MWASPAAVIPEKKSANNAANRCHDNVVNLKKLISAAENICVLSAIYYAILNTVATAIDK